jgi:cobalt-zinc-cadmium efflux system outer membrane protein
MRRWFVLSLLPIIGCHTCRESVSPQIEAQVVAGTPACSVPEITPCTAITSPPPEGPLDLHALWAMAIANNPSLREAAADVEAAQGRLIQAGLYPNPRFLAEDESLGTSQGPAGTVRLQLSQEIVTGGKRRLDRAVAARGTDVASLALLGRKFEILTRVRRGYYDYHGWEYASKVAAENVATLEKGVAMTERALKQAGIVTRLDLLRIQALLEQARIDLARNRLNATAAWRRLADEVGSPQLPKPQAADDFTDAVPHWDSTAAEERVMAVHSDLRQAALEAERARLEVERVRADLVPNVTVGGGYSRSFFEHAAGAILSVETNVPLWDRKQGFIHEAEARWARAQAAQQSTAVRLRQDTADAFARYEGSRQQVEKLSSEVIPRLEDSLNDILKRFQRGAAQAFLDILVAEQSLNDARIRLADSRRELWRAIADLEGLMQLDLDEDESPP